MTLRVLEPGLYTLLVDRGRPGTRSLGVPVGGAADRCALALGNALVGNLPDTAALEVTLAGPTLRANCDLGCVLYGAPFLMTSDRAGFTTGKTFTLHRDEELHIGGTQTGARAYFCVCGGFDAPMVLGSRSALDPLQAGADLTCRESIIAGRFLTHVFEWRRDAHTLRVLPGPQAEWFADCDFYKREFVVSPASNRMGLRLDSRALTAPQRELVSEPVCPGSVQVTNDGQCIVLGIEGQTIGGYPKIAQVISADLDKLGQLRAAARITFRRVSLDEAATLYREKQREMEEWLTRLQETFPGCKSS
jgi:5-oxoprolinase (ATP-hydrolysing) subunit C